MAFNRAAMGFDQGELQESQIGISVGFLFGFIAIKMCPHPGNSKTLPEAQRTHGLTPKLENLLASKFSQQVAPHAFVGNLATR